MWTPLADDLWTLTSTGRTAPGVHLPLRTNAVRLPDGGLWLHAPIGLDEDDAVALEDQGPLAHLVAPNLFHHLFLCDAQNRWPDAWVWAPEGLARKQPTLRIDTALAPGRPEAGDEAIEVFPIAGAPLAREFAFLHRPSRTLLLTDLVFDAREGASPLARCVFRLVGGATGPRCSRSWRWLFVKDRPAFVASVQALLDAPFDRVLLAHGPVLEGAAVRAHLGTIFADWPEVASG